MPSKQMKEIIRPFSVICRLLLAAGLVFPVAPGNGAMAIGAQIWLKDGRVLEGKLGLVSSLVNIPRPPNPEEGPSLELIAFVDDGLRRTFVSKRQIVEFRQEEIGEIQERFKIRQPVIQSGRVVKSVGPLLAAEPFDQYGRRIVTMSTAQGPVSIIQCITEITPVWVKVEGHTHVWDMRMATSSLPRETLAAILAWQTNPKDLESRKKVVRFYIQARFYEEALSELEKILKDFADEPGLSGQLEPIARQIRQLSAQRLLDELKLRQQAGQHVLVLEALKNFPSAGVAGGILEGVRQMIAQYEIWQSQRTKILESLDQFCKAVNDSDLRAKALLVCQEIASELNFNSLPRMVTFLQLLEDTDLETDERLALGLSGWLLGGIEPTTKLPLALSMYEVRQGIVEYLNAPDVPSRQLILDRIRNQEAATPSVVARLLAAMKPPWPIPAEATMPLPEGIRAAGANRQDLTSQFSEQAAGQQAPPFSPDGAEGNSDEARTDQPAVAPTEPARIAPGFYRLSVTGLASAPPVLYWIQLPPEYDPHRRYPAILTLHGAASTPGMQIDFWAGPWTPQGWRYGQASRRGYIVIAPAWASEYQKQYQYSAREHAAVLSVLRDACRRFSIDTDRVFLTGHSMGGDAAWDIGLAHPDLWAGVIPFVATSDRYCPLYWQNAELVPFYFVAGELDGDRLVTNSRDFDRYLKRGFNATVVEYLGRGHEFFFDELHRVFDWMERCRRNFSQKSFTVATMRPWDCFFWWVELASMPPATMIDPANWPPPRGVQPMFTRATITQGGTIYVNTGAQTVTVWLSPEIVDFQSRRTLVVNGQRVSLMGVDGSTAADTSSGPRNPLMGDALTNLDLQVRTILEDVRTRADRQHPFWIKWEAGVARP